MYQYRMIFSDIDGTLLDSANTLSDATRDKIRELAARGIPFVLASARSPQAIAPVAKALGIKAPVISLGGSLVLDENGGVLRSVGMPLALSAEIKELVDSRWPEVCCTAYCGPRRIADDPLGLRIREESAVVELLPTKEVLAELPADTLINKLLCIGDPAQLDQIEALLTERCSNLSVHKSWSTYLEIQDGAASKGAAAQFLCQRAGVPLEEAVSFGDNFNDLDMLLSTGLGFAMGNAPQELRRQVGRVTKSNDEGGVLAVLELLAQGALTPRTGLPELIT